jgi:hypothetical protein
MTRENYASLKKRIKTLFSASFAGLTVPMLEGKSQIESAIIEVTYRLIMQLVGTCTKDLSIKSLPLGKH